MDPEPLLISVTHNGRNFKVAIKNDKNRPELIHYLSVRSEIYNELDTTTAPYQQMILLTYTEYGLRPIYKENYALLVETKNIIVDDDGSIVFSMVKHFEKSYVIKPEMKPGILPLAKFLDKLDDKLQGIMNGTQVHINELTKREATRYLNDYFTYYGKSEGEIKQIFNGDYFGMSPKKVEEENSLSIYYNDPYLDIALFNVVRHGGDEEKFRRDITRFKISSLLLSPDEIKEIFLREHAGWQFEERRMEKYFNSNYFGIPRDIEERRVFFDTRDIGFMTHECIDNIIEAARSVIAQSREGDCLVIFGNSPFFLGRALKFILKHEKVNRVLVEFPFSGSPNTARQWFKLEDIVTPERLAHLQARLRRVGLSSENANLLRHDTYFIDVVGSGSGFSYTAQVIFRDFLNAGKPTPNLMLMTMNRLDIHSRGNRNDLIAKENPDEKRHTVLYFPSVKNTRFITMSKEVYVACHMKLDMLSDNNMRGYPEYNACYWQEEYDYLLLQPQYTKGMRILLDYFDYNLQKHIGGLSLGCLSCHSKKGLFRENGGAYGIYCSVNCQSNVCNIAK